jgi:hypothetical protein
VYVVRRSPGNKSVMAIKNGAEGSRTPDLLTASQAFSQLNYGPIGKDFLIYFNRKLSQDIYFSKYSGTLAIARELPRTFRILIIRPATVSL